MYPRRCRGKLHGLFMPDPENTGVSSPCTLEVQVRAELVQEPDNTSCAWSSSPSLPSAGSSTETTERPSPPCPRLRHGGGVLVEEVHPHGSVVPPERIAATDGPVDGVRGEVELPLDLVRSPRGPGGTIHLAAEGEDGQPVESTHLELGCLGSKPWRSPPALRCPGGDCAVGILGEIRVTGVSRRLRVKLLYSKESAVDEMGMPRCCSISIQSEVAALAPRRARTARASESRRVTRASPSAWSYPPGRDDGKVRRDSTSLVVLRILRDGPHLIRNLFGSGVGDGVRHLLGGDVRATGASPPPCPPQRGASDARGERIKRDIGTPSGCAGGGGRARRREARASRGRAWCADGAAPAAKRRPAKRRPSRSPRSGCGGLERRHRATTSSERPPARMPHDSKPRRAARYKNTRVSSTPRRVHCIRPPRAATSRPDSRQLRVRVTGSALRVSSSRVTFRSSRSSSFLPFRSSTASRALGCFALAMSQCPSRVRGRAGPRPAPAPPATRDSNCGWISRRSPPFEAPLPPHPEKARSSTR